MMKTIAYPLPAAPLLTHFPHVMNIEMASQLPTNHLKFHWERNICCLDYTYNAHSFIVEISNTIITMIEMLSVNHMKTLVYYLYPIVTVTMQE